MPADLRSPHSDSDRITRAGAAHEPPVIFFDGVCGLCNQSVDFVLSRDPRGVFRFAPLQGETAKQRLAPADTSNLDTLILQDEQGTHRRSAAVVRVLSRLGCVWKIAAALLWLLRPVRDLGYRVVARSRYRLFGKRDTCRMPTASERERFLP